jgi:hypothetical protein
MNADDNTGSQPAIRAERSRIVAGSFAGLTVPDLLAPAPRTSRADSSHWPPSGRGATHPWCGTGAPVILRWCPDTSGPGSPALYAGLVVIGTPAIEVWRFLAKVALHSMHPGRRALVSEKPVFDDVAARLRDHLAQNVLVDLRLLPATHRHCCDWRAAHVAGRISKAWGNWECRPPDGTLVGRVADDVTRENPTHRDRTQHGHHSRSAKPENERGSALKPWSTVERGSRQRTTWGRHGWCRPSCRTRRPRGQVQSGTQPFPEPDLGARPPVFLLFRGRTSRRPIAL